MGMERRAMKIETLGVLERVETLESLEGIVERY
jgi:hypothetical protein